MSKDVKRWLKEHTVSEPQRDEHGCIIGKEVYDFDLDKCVPMPPTAKAEPFLTEVHEAHNQSKLPPAWREKKS